MMVNSFRNLQFHCTHDQTVTIPLDDGSFFLFCGYERGVDVLGRFDIQLTTASGEDTYWVCAAVLLVLSLFYRFVALMQLYRMSYQAKDATK
jgi:hypothetical protein